MTSFSILDDIEKNQENFNLSFEYYLKYFQIHISKPPKGVIME